MHISLTTLLPLALIASQATAFTCRPTKGGRAQSHSVSEASANAAKTAGGTDLNTKSGFPHDFGGMSGSASNQRLRFPTAECNEESASLLEYPIFADAGRTTRTWKKDTKKKDQPFKTPMRVVYTNDGETLCGVMTHVNEADDGQGLGDFAVCD